MDLSPWITRRRFDEYLVAANHDAGSAGSLYEWNVAVSGAFFELICHVEVALRNAVDEVLRPLEVVDSARVESRAGWWFASATFLTEKDLTFYENACRHLGKRLKTSSRDKVLASMTFGLWEAVFGPSHEQLFRRHLVYAFPNRGAGFQRETVQTNVLALKNLRNRIAHHQAIFDFPLEERYEQAMELLRWISPALETWVSGQCRVPDLLNEKPEAAEAMAVVVPAKHAWPLYMETDAYVCQPGRFFRQISHLAFYANGAVEKEVPKVLERIECVDWQPEEIERRMKTGDERDRRIAEVIRLSRDRGWVDKEYQLFLLTPASDDGRTTGHVTLQSKLQKSRSGQGSAWVRRQRYASLADLRRATTLGDLDRG